MVYGLVLVAAVLAVWIVATYNFFVATKARIKASVQEIGNQLKRQADLIPNLESSVKGYLKHEKGIFETLAEARKAIAGALKSGDIQKMADAASKLASVLPNISIAVESNPQIKGNEVIVKLMDELRDTSDKVMYARRLVIDLTADFNVKRATFPANVLAGLFGIKEQPGLITPEAGEHVKVDSSDLKTPKVNL
jgi:LemA protein